MPSRVLEDAVTDPATSALRMQSSSAQWGSSALCFFLGGLLVLVIFLILILILRKIVNPPELLKLVAGINKQRATAELFSGNLRTVSHFDFQTLKKATKNFHPDHLLGKGGFGPVYLGKLEDGRLVAVKKLSLDTSRQGESEFLAEVRTITSIQHRNLVRLLGCCYDGPQRLLVYEYLKNRSLDLILYGKSNKFLNWSTRFQIIVGIARGLQYLHEDSHLRIVHRDIKASNILLDDKFQPRIGDFGLARFFPEDQAYLSTTFAGTLGYIAPEYAIRGELSEKADIYSFGVLVLEIICCRKNTDFSLASKMQYLPEYSLQAWKLYEGSRVLDLVDPNMREDGFVETDVLLAIHVAFLCLQNHANLRPPMSQIVALLTCKVELDKTPPRPIFLDPRRKMNLSWDVISDDLPSKMQSESPSSPKTPN
ncbi:cold-responsive protein kinase 1-like isoform X1 [Juglans microcarpa x Juglans regia]|uniref:cold-responsive protein kinase 1-like isoform X1 n=1 Tax=Juglans microcarpa x Juglans regia TaxID=2249226 RepID=UPI001B7F022D|nr:cold-responsive protein kinase 1-like isoform X1 [Juglans microcarpa x Juglans regia]